MSVSTRTTAFRLALFEGPSVNGPSASEFHAFRECQRIPQVHAEITNGAVHLGMTEQELNCAQVARLMVDLRNLGAPHRVCAISALLQPDGCHPFPHQPGILPRGSVRSIVQTPPATGALIPTSAATRSTLSAFPRPGREFEANRLRGLALGDRGPLLHLASSGDVRDTQANEVAAS